MTLALTQLRTNPAVWVAPIVTIAAARYAMMLPPATLDPFPLALTTVSTWTSALIAPVMAACSAWEGGRLRRSRILQIPSTRPFYSVVLRATGPALSIGLGALAAAVVVRFHSAGWPGPPDFRVVFSAALLILSFSAAGFAIGLRTPFAVAVPATLVGGFFALVAPAAMQPLWLRHLTGIWGTCCTTGEDISPRALAGSSIIFVGILISSSLAIRRTNAILCLLALPIAFFMAAIVASSLGRVPAVPRSAQSLDCEETASVRVCVWKEHQHLKEQVAAKADEATAAWSTLDVALPAVFTEYQRPSKSERSASFSISSTATPANILIALSESVVSDPPSCPEQDARPHHLGASAGLYLVAWLASKAGLNDTELAQQFPTHVVNAVRQFTALPPDEERAWFKRTRLAWETCDTATPSLIE